MLRTGYLPSDFHPLFLILGEAADLAALVAVLRRFKAAPAPLDLAAAIPDARATAALRLVPAADRYGLVQTGEGAFDWHLNAWQAGQIAQRVDALCAPDTRSGSTLIELGVPDEIPLKISRGEFTDDFLAAPT
jgi:hypothetical protein